MIRIDAVWLAVEPLDLRIGMDTAPARVVAMFGAAQPHHADVFTDRRGHRIKGPVHDGFGVWPAVRRLHLGRCIWTNAATGQLALSREPFDALVPGLPWRALGAGGAIRVL